MRQSFLIGLKDVKLVFRDRPALLFMLLAPFLLTVGLGFVAGQFGRAAGGIEPIPVAIVNEDDGPLGQALLDLFHANDLAELVVPVAVADRESARARLDADEVAAVVIVPPGFSASVIPTEGSMPSTEVVKLTLIKNPARPIGAGVIQAIVEAYLSRVETGRVGGEVIIAHLVASGRMAPAHIAAQAPTIGGRLVTAVAATPVIRLHTTTAGAEPQAFNPMATMAPGMALLFLMFTVANGGRSLLQERDQGTLPRLLVAPVTPGRVLIGKALGTYLTGVLQMLILILTGSLLFGLRWGDPLGVFVLILAAVFGAMGWAMLLTAVARTPGQVSALGTALMLTFGILGGSFVQLGFMPAWFRWLSRITPNAWGLDGFTILALGGTLADLSGPLLGLTAMGLLLGAVAVPFFRHRYSSL